MDWCVHRRVYNEKKKKQKKKKKQPRREKTKLSVNAREGKKERWEETGWSILIIGTTEKRRRRQGNAVTSQEKKKEREETERNSFRIRQKKREKKCVYTESGQRHVLPYKSYCIHFPVIRESSSSHTSRCLCGKTRWGKEDACNALSKGFQSHT